jgi:hypothetical protein
MDGNGGYANTAGTTAGGAGTAGSASAGAGAGAAQSGAGGTATGGGAGGVATGGSAGTAGGSGSAGAGGGTSASPCGTTPIFCTDFESPTIPNQLQFFPEYLRAMQTFITLDGSVVHGGKQALKVTGTDFSQMLGVTVPAKFWARLYLRSDTDIQEGHNTYFTAGTSTGDPNMGTYIRVGEHECQLELNRNTDDKELLSNGGMYMCQGGVKLFKDTWYCMEAEFDGTGAETRVFVDGTEVTQLHTTDWGQQTYQVFKLGFEKYHGGPKTLWYDDLAIGPERISCL